MRRFKRAIRASFKGFLRFTHRNWFHDIAEEAQTRALFRMTSAHLGTDALYAEVKERTCRFATPRSIVPNSTVATSVASTQACQNPATEGASPRQGAWKLSQ